MVATKEKSFYLTDSRYIEVANLHFAESGIEVVETTYAKVFDVVREILSGANATTVGFEDAFLSVADFEVYQATIGGTFVPVSKELVLLRAIKDADEIKAIAEAAQITDKAFSKLLPEIKVGMTEKQIMARLNYHMLMCGADGMAFDTIVASGPNSSKPHAVPSDRPIQSGDLLLFDFGAKKNGYCSDMTRTVAVGQISPELKKLYKQVKTAQELALKAYESGITGHQGDAIAREFFTANGVGELFVHSLGHGVGVEIHETPRLAKGVTDVLEENMVVTCEPGLYIPNVGGIRIEDTVVIKKGGIVNLTGSKKDFIKL